MKITEKDIQDFIWKNRNNLNNYFNEVPPIQEKKDGHITSTLYYHILEEYMDTYKKITNMSLWGKEVSFPKEKENKIRTDLLGNLNEENGLVVCELKKSGQTERQSFTELLAYGNYVRDVFTPMSKNDIVYLLVCPMEQRIVKEAILNFLVYERNRLCVLTIPHELDRIEELRFSLWVPSFDDFQKIHNEIFAPSNICTFKITWQSIEGKWNPPKGEDTFTNDIINNYNTLSNYAAQLMEAKGIHGFVYSSSMLPQYAKNWACPNSFVISAINPYKSALSRHLIEQGCEIDACCDVDLHWLNLTVFFPSLKNHSENDNNEHNYFSDMGDNWENDLVKLAFEVINFITMTNNGVKPSLEWGIFNWGNYCNSLEEEDVFKFNMQTTGIYRELYSEYLKQKMKTDYTCNKAIVDYIYSQEEIRKFIKHQFSFYNKHSLKDEIDDKIIFFEDND